MQKLYNPGWEFIYPMNKETILTKDIQAFCFNRPHGLVKDFRRYPERQMAEWSETVWQIFAVRDNTLIPMAWTDKKSAAKHFAIYFGENVGCTVYDELGKQCHP